MRMIIHADTIVAIATPPGKGAVGIVRLSGTLTQLIAQKILKRKKLLSHQAVYAKFYDQQEQMIDHGLAIFFEAPHSFTGEDVLELQGHGSPIVMDMILKAAIHFGARLAKPGEFSERAFLNDKMDLAQAEAVADLINAQSQQAARSALSSLEGKFSSLIQTLLKQLIKLRVYVEAAIDFTDEEIDFLKQGEVKERLLKLIQQLKDIQQTAKQGVLLQEGLRVVIAGKPNAGKSSLLNALSGREAAIVTEIEGTTRDVLREYVQVDGLPLHIIDTAGLRESTDVVEQEGMKRAWQEIEKSDYILLIDDVSKSFEVEANKILPTFWHRFPKNIPIIVVKNKIDLVNEKPRIEKLKNETVIYLSVKSGEGLELLKQFFEKQAGFQAENEGIFTARRRHLEALEKTQNALSCGLMQLEKNSAGELLAEELKQAQNFLGEITGEFSTDDLLGAIFSTFCIGK